MIIFELTAENCELTAKEVEVSGEGVGKKQSLWKRQRERLRFAAGGPQRQKNRPYPRLFRNHLLFSAAIDILQEIGESTPPHHNRSL